MKIENLFVTWQQRSAQSNMPISVSSSDPGVLAVWSGGGVKCCFHKVCLALF